MIPAFHCNDHSSEILESFCLSAMQTNPNSTIPVVHWNDDDNETLFSFNLLWPLEDREADLRVTGIKLSS